MSARHPDGDGSTHVSLRDVAKHAGVSFQTVSKVLKGEGRAAPETRQRIMDAAAQLGYVPNTLARDLATRRTRTIGFITSGLASFVMAPLMRGAEEEARTRGYFTVIALVEGSGEHADRLLHQLIERRVDGIVNAAFTLQQHQHYGEMLRKLAPTVTLFPIHGGGVPMVGADQTQIGRLATRHLIERGHRIIGSIVGESDYAAARRNRLRGWELELQAIGAPAEERLVEYGQWSAEGGYAATHRLLDRCPEITAVFAHNDHMAIGAIKALEERGRRVPTDCAVVGCDDIDLARFTRPALTTIRMSFEECGANAMRVLLDHLSEDALLPDRVTLPTELIVRESSGTPVTG
jgi:LacI family transcriptional regulator